MTLLSLMKLFHALFLFVKEMWLRDRTFRQFVRENLSFILVSIGFTVMTVLFVNLYVIVKDQENQLAISEQSLTHANDQLTDSAGKLSEQKEATDFWRDRYLAIKDEKSARAPSQATTPMPAPDTSKPTPQPTTRPPSKQFIDRWKRLNH